MKKITFLFALLCASMMTWAAEWTGQVTGTATNVWLDGIGSNENRTEVNYTVNYLVEYNAETLTITLGYTEDNFNKTVGLVPQVFVNGAFKGNFDGVTWSSTDFVPGAELNIYFYFAYAGGASNSSHFSYTIPSDGGGEGTEPEPEPTPEPGVIDWSSISWLANGEGKYKLVIEPAIEDTYGGKKIDGENLWVGFPSAAFGTMSIEPSGGAGAWRTFALSNFLKRENKFTVVCDGTTYTFTVYYADGIEGEGTGKTTAELSITSSTTLTLDATISETSQITWTSNNENTPTFTSSNANVVTVSEAGLLTAIGRGTATITVEQAETSEYFAGSKKIDVTVNGPIVWNNVEWLANGADKYKLVVEPAIEDTYGGKKIDGTNLWIGFPSAAFGTMSIEPSGGAGAWRTFALSNFPLVENEFTINCGGVIYTFYLYNADGASADGLVESITLNQTSATMEVGQSVKLTAEIAPVTAADKSITWKSSDESVATVSDGTIVAQGVGTATITASANDGSGISATCSVTVNAVTEKTWWGVGSIDGNGWVNVPVMYSITRNLDRTLTYTVYFGGDASGKVIQVCLYSSQYRNLNYNSTEQIATYTTEEKFAAGDKMDRHFFFFGGPTIELTDNYSVGDANEKPSTAVESVGVIPTTSTLGIGETMQLIATVQPSYADDKSLVWSSNNSSVASVDNTGLVTAHTAGEAIITITSVADNTKTASCVVTVVGALEPATWYGAATFMVKGKYVGISYSITRTEERKLYYQTTISENVVGMVMKIMIDGVVNVMPQNNTTRTAEWTSESTYIDGTTQDFSFRPAFDGGDATIEVPYTVGSSNTPPTPWISLGDGVNNPTEIDKYQGANVNVIFNRTITATNEWFTLCLPFDMDEDKVFEVFGNSTIATLVSSEDRGSIIHLNFDYVKTIYAGKAYMIKPGKDFVAGSIIEGVTIKNVNPENLKSTCEHMYFQGVFDQYLLEGDNKRFVGPNNYLYSPADGGTTMGAFRCYFTIPVESQALVGSKAARIVFGPQVATGTENVQSDQAPSAKVIIDGTLYIIRDGRTYNAQGQLVK